MPVPKWSLLRVSKLCRLQLWLRIRPRLRLQLQLQPQQLAQELQSPVSCYLHHQRLHLLHIRIRIGASVWHSVQLFSYGKIHLALPQYLHIIVDSTNELASVREAL